MSLIGRTTFLFSAALFGSSCSAYCQTLEQTVAFIMAEGFVQLGDMQRASDGTVVAKTDTLLTNIHVKAVDREKCVVERQNFGLKQSPEEFTVYDHDPKWGQWGRADSTWYLNNVVLELTSIAPPRGGLPGVNSIWLRGEDQIVCFHQNSQPDQCKRETDIIAVKDYNVSRVRDAIKYLYTKFCTSAQRKSAF